MRKNKVANSILRRGYLKRKLNKNRAFTLIELLAIIVILAVIAVITVPLILNMIESSRLSQAKLSTEGYIDAARYKFSTDYLNQSLKENRPTYLTKKLSTDGQKAKTGALKIQNSGKVKACNIHFDNGYYCNGTKGNVVCSKEELTNISSCGQEPEVNEIWDGFITLDLMYPENSTERMWMLKDNEGIRDSSNTWTYYTGPITIPYDRVEDIWLKYKIDGEEHHSTSGEPFVSIYEEYITDEGTLVNILYDDRASVKEYQIENEGWNNYTKKLLITEPTLISARVKVNDNIYDEDGELVRTEVLTNTDSYLVMPSIIFDFGEDFELSFDLIEKVYAANAKKLTLKVNNGKYKVKNIYYKVYKNGEDSNDYNFIEYKEPITVEEGYNVDSYYVLDVNGREYISKITTKQNKVSSNTGNSGSGNNGSGSGNTESGGTGEGSGSTGSNEIPGNTGVVDPETGKTKIPSGEDYESVKPGTDNVGQNSINKAPIINLNYSSDYKSVEVTLTADITYKKMMIKIGDEKFTEYTGPITLKKNTTVEAYYIDNDDYSSYHSKMNIDLIKIGSLPTLGFEVKEESNKVNVTITSDSDNIEYSFDNINFSKYKNKLEITENKTIYAKSCNEVGCTNKEYSITSFKKPTLIPSVDDKENNTGGYDLPIKKAKLSITFDYDPKETSNNVEVTISFDPSSEENTYKIGNGELKEYTGPFTITENTTITAYAKSTVGEGTETLIINNIGSNDNGSSSGNGGSGDSTEYYCTEPEIIVEPSDTMTHSVNVEIRYYKDTKTKQYSFNNDDLINYENEFEISENGTILAHQVCNIDDEIRESTYEIKNILPIPKYVFEYDDYYLIKFGTQLTDSTKLEYNYDNTEWVPYKNDGIILIKPEAANKLKDQNGKFNIYIKDKEGNEKLFTGDYFILEGTVNVMKDKFQIRWTDIKPQSPVITVSPETITNEVTVKIDYIGSNIEQRLYQIIDENGVASSWLPYNGEFKLKHKGVVRARSINNKNIKSVVSEYIVNNVDTKTPEIEFLNIPKNPVKKFNLGILTTDDVSLKLLKYEFGEYNDSYFLDNGKVLYDDIEDYIKVMNSELEVDKNTKITFYVLDTAGNFSTKIIDITNIDDNVPDIEFNNENFNVSNSINIKVNDDSGISLVKIAYGEQDYDYFTSSGEILYNGVNNLTEFNVDYKIIKSGIYTVYSVDSLGNSVIEKINLFSNIEEFDYSNKEETFVISKTGNYRLETWGAQGANISSYIGGYGGYSVGEIYLEEGTTLYINVGGSGANSKEGGYNGGGNALLDVYGVAGGGATHIATSSGLLYELENDRDSILIVSGGGGGANARGDGYGYGNGGSAGGYIGNDGDRVGVSRDFYYISKGGTQESPGYWLELPSNRLLSTSSFGRGNQDINQSGGGSGYYGGGSGGHVGGAGGSSYIGNPLLFNKAMYCFECEPSSDISTKTISVNDKSSEPISKFAKENNGYVRITFLD